MKQKPNQTRQADLITGLLVAALLLALGVALGVSALFSGAGEPETYHFQVRNIGGLKPGDPVRLSGRTIGRVTATRVEHGHEGTHVRVEFGIFRRLRGKFRFSADSRVMVIGKGIFSRAGVVLEHGLGSGAAIENGGEWLHASAASDLDQIAQFQARLNSANETIRDWNAFLESGEALKLAREVAGDVESALTGFDRLAEKAMSSAGGAAAIFEGGGGGMGELRAELSRRRQTIADSVAELERSLAAEGASADRVRDQIQALSDEVAAVAVAVQESSASSADPALQDSLKRLRLLSAQGAASLRLASRDPSAIGDLAARQRVANRFNGGETALEPLHRNERKAKITED